MRDYIRDQDDIGILGAASKFFWCCFYLFAGVALLRAAVFVAFYPWESLS